MRSIGTLHPTDGIEVQPDSMVSLLLAAATAQSFDYPDKSHIVRLTGITTAGVQLNFYANVNSSGAAIPTTGLTTSTTGINQPVLGQRMFQVVQTTGGSTSFSVFAHSSGWVHAEFWRR